MDVAKDVTLALLEHFMQDTGLNQQSKRFRAEARRIANLITNGHTIPQPLETVRNISLREKLQPFIYAILLRAVVIHLHESGSVTWEQAEDLHAYLREQGRRLSSANQTLGKPYG